MGSFPGDTPIENRKSAFKRELIWSSALFAIMFLTVLGLGSTIIVIDLSNKEVFRTLRTYSNELETMLSKLPTTQTLKGYQQQTVITQRLNDFLTKKTIFDSVELYDEHGQLVDRQERLVGGSITGGVDTHGLKPGQQKVETRNRIPIEVPVPIEAGKMGKAVLSVSEDVLARQASQFRNELITKLVGMILIILVMLGLAYLYVLRVLRLTRRIEAEAQNQMRLSYLGLLSSGLAHEIKNPLNSLQMNLQLFEEEAASGAKPEQLASWIRPMEREIKRLERLVNDFLMFARPLKPAIQSTRIAAILEATAELVAEEARRKGVQVAWEVAPGLPSVETDEALLRTCVLNLVLNSIQAAEAPGAISMRAFARGDKLLLEICDEGPGIPEDKREKIFEIFYTTKVGGTGLGLPIARRIAEGLGGTLDPVEKEGPGTCFRIVLPFNRSGA